jgi:hypothetical protein
MLMRIDSEPPQGLADLFPEAEYYAIRYLEVRGRWETGPCIAIVDLPGSGDAPMTYIVDIAKTFDAVILSQSRVPNLNDLSVLGDMDLLSLKGHCALIVAVNPERRVSHGLPQ